MFSFTPLKAKEELQLLLFRSIFLPPRPVGGWTAAKLPELNFSVKCLFIGKLIFFDQYT
jgi:hypothetical protein